MNTHSPFRKPASHDFDESPDLQDYDDDGIDIRRVLQTLWRGSWIILVVTAIGVGAAALYLARAVPLYTAEAQVRFLTEEERVTDLESVVSGISPEGATLNTETMVLQSHRLLGRVVDEMDLAEDPEFFARPEEGSAPAAVAPPGDEGGRARTVAIKTLRNKLDVSVIKNSYVLSIQVETQDPVKSADIANALASAYVDSQLEGKFEATRRATKWLSDEVAKLKAELEAAETAVEDFAAASPAASGEAMQRAASRTESLRDRRRERLARKESLQETLDDAETLRQVEDFEGAAKQVEDPRLEDLARRIAAASGSTRQALVESFDGTLADRRGAIEAEIAGLNAQVDTLTTAVAQAERSLEARSGQLIELRQLEREAAATRLLYEHFLSRMKETSVQEGVQKADSEVLAWAMPPSIPSYPNRQSTLMRAAALSLLLGGGLVFLLEHMNRRLRTPEELEQATGLPVFAVVPAAPGAEPLSHVIEKPGSAVAESVRNLRTSVLMSNLDRPPQVIMMTSSLPQEGKSTTLMMLGQITARMGRRTLVIEGDIRRPRFREILEQEPQRKPGLLRAFAKERPGRVVPGLLSALSGAVPVEEAIRHDKETGLDVIFSEKSKANAADIFSSDRFRSFIGELRQEYDTILLDTPPVLVVPDARIIAHVADAVLYAVRWNATTRDQVASGLKLLAQAQVGVTGLFLTRVDARSIQRYGYEGYGSAYGGNLYYKD